ncbi:MAG TPA: MBL fold metallo-hydrolase [Thermomicrobiales bacterium]|nr:MBL fold metallo-hydrolase [Thermomicrobiales bacterium]
MLVQLGERVWALPGGVNIGVVRGDGGRVLLIDTGLNETAGKKALKAVREVFGDGVEVAAILTTHGHADHFGANAAVVKRSGARVYAPRLDEAVLRYPPLQPAMLYGGADPMDGLRTPFLLAHASPVDVVVAPGPLAVEGVAVEVVDLAGHSPGQVGYLVDGVFFCADVVLPDSVLDKYRIPYLFGVTDHLAALETARSIGCESAVPGHGPLLDAAGMRAAVERNRALADAVAVRVLELAAKPASAEDILAGLLVGFGSPAADAPGFYLLQPTAFAFLAHLHRQGLLRHEVGGGRSTWTAEPSG